MGDGETLAWEAPGPGQWTLDRSHYPGGTTPIAAWWMTEAMSAGLERVFAELGAPVRTVDARFVNGFMYTRRRPLIAPDRPASKLPPERLLRLAAHAHPEMRRRAKQARHTLDHPPQRGIVRDWNERRRPQLIGINRSLQGIDPATLSDAELDQYVSMLLDHTLVAAELHFWLHGHDLGPIAQFLERCERWGLDPERAVRALAGASPSTARPAARLARLRALVEAAGVTPTSLDDVRAVSDDARRLLDEHLDEHGHILATGYDITATTLIEMPGTLLDSITTAPDERHSDHEQIIAELAAQLDDGRTSEFLEVVEQARLVMDMRDDNGPLTVEWPAGLVRRALLAAGDRLVAAGHWSDRELALEVTPDEARRLLASNGAPGPTELGERAERRRWVATVDPPVRLGVAEPEPPPDVLPDPLPEFVQMIQTAFRHMGMDGSTRDDGLAGVGVGTEPYTGRARVVATADQAIETLVPGDVLVVRATSPAFNVVLAIAGAVVTADGGAMSHAAVLARELGIAAVVGARDALTLPDGATICVDPIAGTVSQVDT